MPIRSQDPDSKSNDTSHELINTSAHEHINLQHFTHQFAQSRPRPSHSSPERGAAPNDAAYNIYRMGVACERATSQLPFAKRSFRFKDNLLSGQTPCAVTHDAGQRFMRYLRCTAPHPMRREVSDSP